MILSAQVPGNARTVVSFSGVILNNRESNRMYLSANISTFLIAALEVDNLFCDKYWINVFKMRAVKISGLNPFYCKWQMCAFRNFPLYHLKYSHLYPPVLAKTFGLNYPCVYKII